MIKTVNKYLKIGKDERTKRANLNVILSFIFRGASVLFQFALVPLTINYIQSEKYGVWITILSVVGWIALLDIGMANGLKNKLSESLSTGDYKTAKLYVSSTYVLITLFAGATFTLYLILNHFINWQHIFNSSFISESELKDIVTIVFSFFLLKFITDIINVIAASFQYPSLSSFLLFLSNLCLYVAVLVLTKTTNSNLFLLTIIFSVIPFIISLGANIYLFSTRYNFIKPSFNSVNIKKTKGLLSLGAKFFILQIATLIIFQTDNILIANLFNPKEVTVFNIVYKYFSVIIVLFALILSPYWTAFTEAYFKRDFVWLRSTMNRLIFMWLLSLIPLVLMLLLSKAIIKLWIGNSVSTDISLLISIFFYIAIVNWNSIFAIFLNGIGKIRVQIICVIIVALLNIPLSIFFVRFLNWGIFSIPLANFICLSLGAVVCYVQYKKIINGTAYGLWNK